MTAVARQLVVAAAQTGPVAAPADPAVVDRTGCEPAYPTVCIAQAPPDLDCPEIPYRDFKVLQPSDPHRFDADRDGIGCESTSR